MILATALLCLSANIYHEARGESIPGQYAVAQVTMSRAKTPDKVCDTVMAKHQFSWTTKLVKHEDGKYGMATPKDDYAWWKATRIAATVLEGKRGAVLDEGTTHYHTKQIMPNWAMKYRMKAIIGNHVFYQRA